MASAISSSSACGSRSQAMANALAVERLMPAQQWITIGAAASQSRPNAKTSSTIAASGATSPSIGTEMSWQPMRRCRSSAKPAGVSIMSSGGSNERICEGARRGDHLREQAQGTDDQDHPAPDLAFPWAVIRCRTPGRPV